MKQRVQVALTVDFPDDVLQPDVDEALGDALSGIKKMLKLLPAVKGTSKTKRTVSFKIVDIDRS